MSRAFISRIDALIEKRFAALESNATDEAKQLMRDLNGKIAIANAKVAYQSYKKICEDERFKKLVEQGAQPQRLLWASTGTKIRLFRRSLCRRTDWSRNRQYSA